MKLVKTLLLGASMLAMTACGNTETVRPTFYVNEDGHLIEVYNGNETDLGLVKGQDGKDGTDGQNGRDGKDGADGKDGVNGQDGKDGRDGEVIYVYTSSEQSTETSEPEPEVELAPEVELYTVELSLDELTPSDPMRNLGFNYVDLNASISTLNNSKKKLNDSIKSCQAKGYTDQVEEYQEAYNAVCKLIQFKTIIDIRTETRVSYNGLAAGRMKANTGYNIYSLLLGSSQLMAPQIVQDKDYNSIMADDYQTNTVARKWIWSNLQDKDITLTFNCFEGPTGIYYGGAETIRVSYAKEA